jgi:hypothetical protein
MRMLVTISLIIIALVIDTLLTKIYAFTSTGTSFTYDLRINVFFAMAIAYSIGVYFVLELVKIQSSPIVKSKLHLDILHKVILAIQFFLAAILFLVFFQMRLTSHYSVTLTALVVGISYALAIVMMSLLSYRFFSWFRFNRNAVVLSYGISSIVLALNAIFTVAFVINLFIDVPPETSQHLTYHHAPFIPRGSLTDVLNNAYIITSIVSFVLWWITTSLLLRHYSQRLGKGKYWVAIAMPLSYFLMQFLPAFPQLLTAFTNSSGIFFIYTTVFTLSKPVGGILFGIAFWMIVKSLSHNNIVRHYMIISAYGLILLFVSNQAIVLVNFSYPPFGIATISFMGLSAYLILVGIYSSAISVSHDMELRKIIRKYAFNESKLLGNIGFAQMEQEIERRVMTISKEKEEAMEQATGLPSSIDEENVKQYLESVIREIRDNKKMAEEKK